MNGHLNYKEELIFKKSYTDFLLKLTMKKEIKFQYYSLKKNGEKHDCSFTGYHTNEGIHGLHFDRTIVNYYFGERNNKFITNPFYLLPPFIKKIPPIIKDALLYVANNKKSVFVKNNKMIECKSGNLVSG